MSPEKIDDVRILEGLQPPRSYGYVWTERVKQIFPLFKLNYTSESILYVPALISDEQAVIFRSELMLLILFRFRVREGHRVTQYSLKMKYPIQ